MWHKQVNIAVLNYNTSYHRSIGCEPSRDFHGRIPYNILDLKLGIRPQQQPIPTSQIAQDVLDQTEKIHQDVLKNSMQAYIRNKTYYDKKANASKQKKQIMYMSCSRKRIIKRVKFLLQIFVGLVRILLKKYYQKTIIWYAKLAPKRRKCLIICECVSSHAAKHQLTYQSSHKNIKPDPEVCLNHDDSYARAWEYDYEHPIFDAESDNAVPLNSQELPV